MSEKMQTQREEKGKGREQVIAGWAGNEASHDDAAGEPSPEFRIHWLAPACTDDNLKVMAASQFSAAADGALEITRSPRCKSKPYRQPMIAVPRDIYSAWFGENPLHKAKTTHLTAAQARDVLARLQLHLPLDSPHLRDMELLSRRPGAPGPGAPHPLAGPADIVRGLLRTTRDVRLFAEARPGRWAEDERATWLCDVARTGYRASSPVHRQRLADFCAGAGPSDPTLVVKRLIDEQIAAHCRSRKTAAGSFSLPSCWAPLYRDVYPSVPGTAPVVAAGGAKAKKMSGWPFGYIRARYAARKAGAAAKLAGAPESAGKGKNKKKRSSLAEALRELIGHGLWGHGEGKMAVAGAGGRTWGSVPTIERSKKEGFMGWTSFQRSKTM